jgi:DNA polymerase-3 subunit delta
MLLHEYVGNSLRSLDGEIAKVLLYIGDRKQITEDDVLAAVGASRGFTVFDLQRAIGTRKLGQCFKIVRLILQGGLPATTVVNSLTRFFNQLWKLTDPEVTRLEDAKLAAELGTKLLYLRDYKQYRRSFAGEVSERAFGILHELDTTLKSARRDEAISLEIALHAILRKEPEYSEPGTELSMKQ